MSMVVGSSVSSDAECMRGEGVTRHRRRATAELEARYHELPTSYTK